MKSFRVQKKKKSFRVQKKSRFEYKKKSRFVCKKKSFRMKKKSFRVQKKSYCVQKSRFVCKKKSFRVQKKLLEFFFFFFAHGPIELELFQICRGRQNGTLTGTTTPEQSGSGSNINERGIPHSPDLIYRSVITRYPLF